MAAYYVSALLIPRQAFGNCCFDLACMSTRIARQKQMEPDEGLISASLLYYTHCAVLAWLAWHYSSPGERTDALLASVPPSLLYYPTLR